MRSRSWLALVLLTGCGNYSTEDLRFLAAVPTTEMLQVEIPASESAAQSAPVTCDIGTAEIWTKAKTTGNNINSGVGVVLWLADHIRSLEPSRRTTDSREWGPFDDRRHPGFENLITLTRQTGGCDSDVSVCYQFELWARAKGQSDFGEPILDATFQGGSADHGHGLLHIYFDRMQTLGVIDADSPGGTMNITYSRVSDPRRIDLESQQPTTKLAEFDYQWRRFADGHGSFAYRFTDTRDNVITATTLFDAAGEGRAVVSAALSAGGTVSYSECWDADACVSWVNDTWNVTELCSASPCQRGAESACKMP